MRIHFFGRLGDQLGRAMQLAPPPGTETVADLRQLLARLHPDAEAELMSPRLRACIDDAMVTDAARLDERSEVAFLPPLSGG